ncbi:hypothetical protein NDN08_008237 [Rhodosorus marinus]|uniref:Peptidase S59 domain-containing protein n=1 Tax=Rhodosorus marinus TaxID=101924 RepID=A0AAV8V2M8_9RHOD|nr:hypothetical protein NDN08_008237 [Rhodosorus marinus]
MGGGGGSLFGGSSTMGGGSGGGLMNSMSTGGMNTGATGGGLFSSGGSSAFGKPAGGGFGASGSAFGQSSSAFGQQTNTFGANTTPFGGNTIGGDVGAKGTAGTKYQVTGEYDSTQGTNLRFQSISLMPAYKNKSVEELRVEDYQLGNKGGQGGASGGGMFGAASGSQMAPGGSTFGGGFGGQSSSSSLWGGSQQPATQSGFGGASTPAFGGSTQGSLFGGNTTGLFNSSPSNSGGGLFGKPASSGFGSTPAGSQQSAPALSNAFVGSTGTSLTGGAGGGQFGQATPAFGQSSSAPSFGGGFSSGGAQGGGLFGGIGGGANTQQSAPTLGAAPAFGASSSTFSLSAAPTQAAKPFSTPTLSAPGQFGSGLSGGLFASSSASSSSLAQPSFSFGGQSAAAPSTSLFNSTPTQAPQQPLQTTISASPYGASQLFSSPVASASPSKDVQLTAGRASGPAQSGNDLASKASSPSVYRRTPRSNARVRPRSYVPKSGNVGGSASIASLFGSTNGSPAFSASNFLGGKDSSPWKSPDKSGGERNGNIKTLVIEPVVQTPPNSVARTLALSDIKRSSEGRLSTPNGTDRDYRSPSGNGRSTERAAGQRLSYGTPLPESSRKEVVSRPTPRKASAANDSPNTVDFSGSSPAAGNSRGNEREEYSLGDIQPHSASFAPILTREGYYSVPEISVLRQMSEENLREVEAFTVGRSGIGEVTWTGKTDLRNMDLDTIVQLEPREVIVYADEDDKPALGEGLNKPAEVTLEKIFRKDKKTGQKLDDDASIESLVKRLKAHCEKEGLTFLSYEASTELWRFRADHFSRYYIDEV